MNQKIQPIAAPSTALGNIPFDVTLPADGKIGAEITNLNPRVLDERGANIIKDLVYRYKLVVFRGQELNNQEYIQFAKKIGTPQIYFQHNYHHPGHPEIFVSSNVPENGKKIGVAGTGRYWHTDCQFFDDPLPMTFVYPKQLPNGRRETYYIDMERVNRELPPDLRQWIDGRRAIHEAKWRYKIQASDIDKSITEILLEFGKLTPPVTHPAVIEHPVTRAKSLYISEGFTVGIEGIQYEDAKAALQKLFKFIEREDHVHVHPWRGGDILLWDNRTLLHKASSTPPGQASVSYRIGVYDGLPFYVR
ncbi:MAG: TauD/TfdA dioxygenase family protein [Planctomycetota bacterium]